jgi:hypothetical protein
LFSSERDYGKMHPKVPLDAEEQAAVNRSAGAVRKSIGEF